VARGFEPIGGALRVPATQSRRQSLIDR